MNLIERLRDHLLERYPQAKVELIAPLRPKGIWSLDIDLAKVQLSIQWSSQQGFGISNVYPENFGEGPDEVYSNFDDALRRAGQLLKGDEQSTPPFSVLLARLRERRGLTQQDVASKLGITQATVSGIEHREDIQLSTLQRLIGALGGYVEVLARFPDHSYRLVLPCTDETRISDPSRTNSKRRVIDTRQRHSQVTFFQLRKTGRLQGAEETAKRIKNTQSVFEMY